MRIQSTGNPGSHSYVLLTLGHQQYRTSISSIPTGEWNEAFEFEVNLHTKLFGILQVCVHVTHCHIILNNTFIVDVV
jgi:hypothetical protein